MQIDSENIPKNENFDPRTATSEAEVRLVVRFTVEEHIVYKGKVERIQQLESEVLSRVVSRVAWDGAKEHDKSKSDDNDKAQETNSQEQDQPDQPPESNYCKQINNINEPDIATLPIDTPDPTEKSPDQVQEKSASNTDTSDHIAYVKSNPAPKENEDKMEVEEIPTEVNLVAQVETPQTVESKTTNDCDITTETQPSNNNQNNCETEMNQCTQDSSPIQESENRRTNVTPKEQRLSNSRTCANRNVVDNSATKQVTNPSTKSNNTNMSLLANNQQNMRQNKIFAKWSDNHFYPGTILKQAKDRKFVVGFLDGAQKIVAETDLIPLCNIEGKQVRVSIAKNYCVNAIVHNQRTPVNDQPMFEVEYQQDGLVKKCVPLKDLFLTGDQGTPLINQVDKNSGASNFADVDLDNIIYEKRSRRLQDMEDFELTENSTITGKRRRGQHGSRNTTPRAKNSSSTTSVDCSNDSPALGQKRHSQNDIHQQQAQPQQQQEVRVESADSPDVLKTNFLCPNSNPPSEGSSSTGSSNVPNVLELGQEFYFTSSSPHRTKASLLL